MEQLRWKNSPGGLKKKAGAPPKAEGSDKMVFRWLMILVAILWIAPGPGRSQAVDMGGIKGAIVDAETGEPLIGANVVVDGTTLGTATDLDGSFFIPNLEPGNYTLTISYIGYAETKITDLKLGANETVTLSLAVEPETLATEEVVVEARMLKNTEAALLKNRQLSSAISDAISAENISRSGSGNAAEAMTRVTGASVVGGKYVLVRGLGERYSSTQLNGAELPSADPDKKAFQMDLIPSNLLDNIVTKKTFTPDEPGNFSGGIVNIATRNFPDKLTLKFSTSASANSQATGQTGVIVYPVAGRDWLAKDDGSRAIPTQLSDPETMIPPIGEAFTDRDKAYALDVYTKAFNPRMTPVSGTIPLNQSYAFSIGNQTPFFGVPLGYLASLSYKRDYSYYGNGTVGRWQLTDNVESATTLTEDFLLSDTKSSSEVLIGGLLTMSYRPHRNHEISSNLVYNRSGESVARYSAGEFPRDLSGNATYETRLLHYTQRSLFSLQMEARHHLPDLKGLNISWTTMFANSKQEEPDIRYFTDNFTIRSRGGEVDTIYSIRPSIYPLPTRYFRNLDENNRNVDLKLTLPFRQWEGLSGSIKWGGSYSEKKRTFEERRFEFRQDRIQYSGNPDQFFSAENNGIVDSSNGFYRFGNYVVDVSELRGSYSGTEKVGAGFLMIDLPLLRRLRLVSGVRYETTRMRVASKDTTLQAGFIQTNDWLPSANLVYQVGSSMNFRAAYGRTLARPTFRELVPYGSFDFVGDFIFIGNPELERTLIHNFDLRWEWFMRPGELVAVSGFYKRLVNPIERVIINVNGEVSYQNVNNAKVYGAEFEIRKKLDQVHPLLNHIHLGGNLSLIRSLVSIPPEEMAIITSLEPDADNSRPLQGQSPYIVNLELGYENYEQGTSIGIYYHVFGERLSAISLGGTPDVYEQSSPMLNVTLSQRIWKALGIKSAVRNILDSSFRQVHHFKGNDYIYSQYKIGRSYSFGITYDVN